MAMGPGCGWMMATLGGLGTDKKGVLDRSRAEFLCFHVCRFIGKTDATQCYCKKNTHSTMYTLLGAQHQTFSILRRVTNSASHPTQSSFTNRPSSNATHPFRQPHGAVLQTYLFPHRLADLTTPNSSRKPPMAADIH